MVVVCRRSSAPANSFCGHFSQTSFCCQRGGEQRCSGSITASPGLLYKYGSLLAVSGSLHSPTESRAAWKSDLARREVKSIWKGQIKPECHCHSRKEIKLPIYYFFNVICVVVVAPTFTLLKLLRG